jgi:hypothetical protein
MVYPNPHKRNRDARWAHRGLGSAGARVQAVVDDDRAAEAVGLAGKIGADGLRGAGRRGSPQGVPVVVCRGSERPELHRRQGIYQGKAAHRRRLLDEISVKQKLEARLFGSGSSLGLRRDCCRAQRGQECSGATARQRRRGAGAVEPMGNDARASVAAAAARVGAEEVGDPICRAAGHPWRAGQAQELAGVLGRPVHGEEERGERRGETLTCEP